MIDRYKVHRMVEYIKLFEFGFETLEVMESLDDVLSYYGLLTIDLDDDEYRLLRTELLPLAEDFEFNEVDRIVFQEEPQFRQIIALA